MFRLDNVRVVSEGRIGILANVRFGRSSMVNVINDGKAGIPASEVSLLEFVSLSSVSFGRMGKPASLSSPLLYESSIVISSGNAGIPVRSFMFQLKLKLKFFNACSIGIPETDL